MKDTPPNHCQSQFILIVLRVNLVKSLRFRVAINFFFGIYCLFCTRTHQIDTNLLVSVGHQGARPKLENLNFFSSSGVFVGLNSTRFVLKPRSCSGLSTQKRDNRNLVTTNHRVLHNRTRSYGMVLCPNYLVQLVPVIMVMTGGHCNVEKPQIDSQSTPPAIRLVSSLSFVWGLS